MLRPLALTLAVLSLAGCDALSGGDEPVREYRVGETVQLNAQFGNGLLCSSSNRDLRSGRVVAITERAIVVADETNPSGGFTDDEYRAYARAFDEQVWPIVTGHFGEPGDLDGNGRVVLFYTRAVNELTPPGQDWYVGGLFAARDLFPVRRTSRLAACSGSNGGEMLYMLVPDPEGEVNGNIRTRSAQLHRSVNVLAHELQHLINASQRLHGGGAVPVEWSEVTWLNEGLSHIAEELMGYGTSDLAPRENADIYRLVDSPSAERALSLHFYPNFDNLGAYLQAPSATSLYASDSPATRGATWQFLRYAADRSGVPDAELWRRFVAPGRSGLANLEHALGADPMDWVHDWLVSVYTDDTPAGADPRYRQPSWDFRGLYPSLRSPDGTSYGRYPLLVHTLSDGTDLPLALHAGSAAYLPFAVPAGTRGEVRTAPGAPSCRADGPALALAVGEVAKLSATQSAVVCVEADAEAEYVFIPFFAAPSGSLALSLRGTGVMPPEGGAPRHAPPAPHAHSGASWEAGFRSQERHELDPLVQARAGGLTTARLGTPGDLRTAIVRIR